MRYFIDKNGKTFGYTEDQLSHSSVKDHVSQMREVTKDEAVDASSTLDDVKRAKIDDIKALYLVDVGADIQYMGTSFQADRNSRDMIVTVLSAGSVPNGFYWLDAANNKVPMTYHELQGLSLEILVRGQSLFDKLTSLKNSVKSCKTKREVRKITW